MRRSLLLPALAASIAGATLLSLALPEPSVPTVEVPTRVPVVSTAMPRPVADFVDDEGRLELYVIDGEGITFRDEDVMDLDAGRSRPGDRHGMLLDGLYDHAWPRIGESTSTPAEGRSVLLAVAPNLPHQTLREVLYTLGQAQYTAFVLLVDGPLRDVPRAPVEPEARGVVHLPPMDPVLVQWRTDAEPMPQPLEALDPYRGETPAGCTWLVPAPGTATGDIAVALSRLYAAGAPDAAIAGAGIPAWKRATGGPARPRPPGPPSPWRSVATDGVLPAVVVWLPRIGPGSPHRPCTIDPEEVRIH